MLTVLAFCCLIGVLLRSDTAVGRGLRQLLVERPARALTELTPARMLVVLLAVVAAAALIAWLKFDGVLLLGRAVPEGLVWFATFDIGLLADAFGAALLFAAALRIRAARRAVRIAAVRTALCATRLVAKIVAAVRLGPAPRATRPRQIPAPGRADDEDGWAALAFA
jgi:hypothetical protein